MPTLSLRALAPGYMYSARGGQVGFGAPWSLLTLINYPVNDHEVFNNYIEVVIDFSLTSCNQLMMIPCLGARSRSHNTMGSRAGV